MNIIGLHKNIDINIKNTPAFTAKKVECKQDRVEFSSKDNLFKAKLDEIINATEGTVDPKVIEEGISGVKTLLSLINTTEQIPEAYKEALKEFSPKPFSEDLKTILEVATIEILNSKKDDLEEINNFDEELDKFAENYCDKMPIMLFKSNLLTLVDFLLPLASDTKSNEIILQTFNTYDKIKNLGLSKEVIEIKDKIENELFIDLVPYNDEKLMKRVYEELTLHHSCYEDLPDYINLNNSTAFKDEDSCIPAFYTKEQDHSSILMNVNMIFAAINLGFTEQIFDGLKHELGHHLHYSNFKNKNLSFHSLLSPDEKKLLKKLKPEKQTGESILNPRAKNKFKKYLELDILDEKNGDSNLFKKTRGLYRNIDALKLNEQDKEALIGIHKKLERVRRLVLKHYIPYALQNPKELVAMAFETSNSIIPTKKMKELLDKFNMPELKDREYLPPNHPVIKQSRRRKSDNQ